MSSSTGRQQQQCTRWHEKITIWMDLFTSADCARVVNALQETNACIISSFTKIPNFVKTYNYIYQLLWPQNADSNLDILDQLIKLHINMLANIGQLYLKQYWFSLAYHIVIWQNYDFFLFVSLFDQNLPPKTHTTQLHCQLLGWACYASSG